MTRLVRLARSHPLWAAAAVALAVLATVALVTWTGWMSEGAELGRTHAAFRVAHPGWSFPARIYSSEVPLSAVRKRLLAEASLRGYPEDCSNRPVPGTSCAALSRVVPRWGQALEPMLLGELVGPDAELREHLPLHEAPRHLIDAILAAEDRDFREHGGVNLRAMLRALRANTLEQGYAQGGSTLTMQVVRSLSQRTEKTLLRKLREMAMAMGLERALGKEAVLQMYLDVPYLGQRRGLSVCGFQAAARHYFGKEARELDLAEAATLVAVLPGPGRLAPDRNPKACKARRDRLLKTMAKLGNYNVTLALEKPLQPVAAAALPERFPSYLAATRAGLEAELPREVVYGAGLVVETGIDPVAQAEAERLFPEKLGYFEQLIGRQTGQPLQATGVAIEVQTGLIRAVYGGTDATATGFNRALQAHRQPGSSFKPLVYALAMSERRADGGPAFTAASIQPNSPRDFHTPDGVWRPRNVGFDYTPTASLAYGLAWSQNVATASLLEQLGGPRRLIAFAGRLGFDTRTYPEELGLALGQAEVTPLEMAQFAALVANGGRRVAGTPVRRVTDAAGAVLLHPPVSAEQVLTPEAAALTRELMRLVVENGTGGAIRGAGGEPGYLGPAIGKTGTTDEEKDLWFVGATPELAAAVWLGYDEPERIGASASDLSTPLWGWWMRAMTQLDPVARDFPREPRLERAAICTETGLLPNPGCRILVASFLPGTAPRAPCGASHEAAAGEGAKAGYESIWKRRHRPRRGALRRRERARTSARHASTSPRTPRTARSTAAPLSSSTRRYSRCASSRWPRVS